MRFNPGDVVLIPVKGKPGALVMAPGLNAVKYCFLNGFVNRGRYDGQGISVSGGIAENAA